MTSFTPQSIFNLITYSLILLTNLKSVFTLSPCRTQCGSIAINYPFGIDSGCGAPQYQKMLNCSTTDLFFETPSGTYKVQSINYPKNTLTLYDPSMSTCSILQPHHDFVMSDIQSVIIPPAPDTVFALMNCSIDSPVLNHYKNLCFNFAGHSCDELYSACTSFRLFHLSPNSSLPPCCFTRYNTVRYMSMNILDCTHYTAVYNTEELRGVGPLDWVYGIKLSFSVSDTGCDRCGRSGGTCGFDIETEGMVCICSSTVNFKMADNSKLHIVMFPWLAFGHMIPFLELAKLIAKKGHKISFVSTSRNIDRLPNIPQNLKPLIDFVKIPLPQVENLPNSAESTADLPHNMVRYLKVAYDLLESPITLFLKTNSPDWVICDFASYWLGPIASDLGIGSVYFSIFMACMLANIGRPSIVLNGEDDRVNLEDFAAVPKWIPFKTDVRMRLYQVRRIFDDLLGDAGGEVSSVYRLAATIRGCDAVAVRSCMEFESEWLGLLPGLYQKPVIEVGLLPSHAVYDDGDEKWDEIRAWLDKRAKGSVIYVAFGSETKPRQSELTELALGLEKSGLPFFWVLKMQLGFVDTELTQLPEGFEERTKDRGIVWTTWAPQLKILSHDSVGSLLSHAGYSSVLEALQFGKALIVLPFLGDQGMIANFLTEKNMAYQIPVDELGGLFTGDLVAESVKLVMVADEGKIYKDKVTEMKELLCDISVQDRYLNNFLNYLQCNKKGEGKF